jgi:opacity protein-like surface antigen
VDGGKVLPNKGIRARGLALAVAAAALAAGWLLTGAAKPAHAEFEIQEAEVEKGEVEIEYRGAYHWGVFDVGPGQAGVDALDNEEEPGLRQSHEVEVQLGITDWWLLAVTHGFDQALGDDLRLTAVELETQFVLISRKGDGVGLAIQGGYQAALNHGDENGSPNEIAFGPIVELAKGPLLLTLNPLFNDQRGKFADQEGLGFEYGWQAKYSLNSRWGVGVEMFGEIEDLANAGSFGDQTHSIGPTIFINFGGDDGDAGEAKADDADDDKESQKSTEFQMNVGVQFGLTELASDAALKVQGALQF